MLVACHLLAVVGSATTPCPRIALKSRSDNRAAENQNQSDILCLPRAWHKTEIQKTERALSVSFLVSYLYCFMCFEASGCSLKSGWNTSFGQEKLCGV
jgi:hypothetical protein